MNWFKRIFQRRDLYNDLSEELRQHLREKTEQFQSQGMSREQAKQAARRAFGNPTLLEERSREVWQWPTLESLWADIKYALRQLRQSPAFAAAVIATLALGIGVNTAIFTVFNQVLLRAMPVHQAQQLVLLREHSRYETGTINTYAGDNSLYFSYPAYQALRKNTVLSDLAVSALAPVTIASPAQARDTWMQLVSGNYFQVLDLQPVLGRLLTPADDRFHAANPVAVLSESYWRAHLGADPSILNRTLLLNGSPVTIVGVVHHAGLMDANPVALFVPVSLQGAVVPVHGDPLIDPLNVWLNLVGRLAPGVSRAQAQTQLNLLWWNWRRDTLSLKTHSIPDQKGWLQTHLTVSDGARGISLLEESFSQPVEILQIMALVVLLIVCGNIANLLLAKAARRHSELAMRAALGASRRRLLQQVIVEGMLLGLIGAVVGLPLGWLTLRLLLHTSPASDMLHVAFAARMDWRIVVLSMAAGLLTSILFSLAPAVLSVRINLLRALHGQSGAVGAGSGRIRSLLVVAQIALSLGLLTCATVFACNLYRLRSIQPGFATTRVLSWHLDGVQQGETVLQANQEYQAIAAGIRRLPGAMSVVYAHNGLLTGDESGGDITVSGHVNDDRDETPDRNTVSPGFFSAMQIPLLAGREFTPADTEPGHKAAIVDQAFVNFYFNGDIQKALSGALILGHGTPDTPIVGVIPTIRATDLTKDPWTPFVYVPWSTSPPVGTHTRQFPAVFYVRTAGDPSALAASVRTLIHGIDSRLPIDDLETMREHLSDLRFDSQLVTILSIAMGALALTLAAIGLYGVLAFSVAQRTREIGVRIAVGADRRAIAALIARRVAWLVLAGSVAGAFLGWLGTRLLVSHDAGLAKVPPWLFAIAGLVLLAAMALAAWLPARRAANVDPMRALRAE
jgi:putative ABC transport system permease protein